MIRLSPVWIISLLPDSEHKDLEVLINKQFKAFTENELNLTVDETNVAHKWWGIDNLNSITYQNQLPQSLIQAYPITAQQVFLTNRMTVVIVSTLYDKDNKLVNFGDISNLQKRIAESLPRSFIIHYYAVFIDNTTGIISDNKEDFKCFFGQNNFSGIIIQGRSNSNPNNTMGFFNIHQISKQTGRNEQISMLCQTLFNLAIGHDKLYGKVIDNNNVFVSGGFSLVFENEVTKSKLAKRWLTIPMLEHFFNNSTDTCWKNTTILPLSFDTNLKKISAKDYYDQCILLFDDEFKNVNRFFRHEVPPWALLSASLVPRYFKYELKTLPQKLVNFGHLLDAKFLQLYRSHLKEKIHSEKGLKQTAISTVHHMLLSLWSECETAKKTPVGIQQFMYNLSLVREQIKAEKSKLLNKDEFDKITYEKEPLKVPKIIRNPYKKLITKYSHGTSEQDISDAEKDPEGNDIGYLKRLIRRLKIHPIPLGLLIRAALLGLVSSVVILTLLKIFPNFIVNTSFFEKGNGVDYLLDGIFAASIVGAILIYLIGFIKKIRVLKKQYLAWVFYKVQRKLIKETQSEIEMIFNAMLSECNKIEKNLKKFMGISEENKDLKIQSHVFENAVQNKEYQYPINYFQQSVIEPIDANSQHHFIQNFDESKYYVNTPESTKMPINSINIDSLYILLAKSFIEQKLYQSFFENVLLKNEMDLKTFAQKFQDTNEKLINTDINSIDEFEYTIKAIEIIKSRSYPTFFDYTASEVYKFAFSIAKVDSAGEDNLPETLYFLNTTDEGVSAKIIPIIADQHHNILLNSFRQYCQYYRLRSIEGLKFD